MSRPLITALAILFTGQTPSPAPSPPGPPAEITAQSLPPIAEPSWQFADQGNVYLVGKTTGKVLVIRGGQPAPDDRPLPPPPIPPDTQPISGVKWFSVIVDPNRPEQAAWRTDTQLRREVLSRGIQFRTYLATEADIDQLGFQSVVGSTGTPTVILQDAQGKMLKVMRPQSLTDIVDLVESIK